MIGAIGFSVTFILCALAPSLEVSIFARVLPGAAGQSWPRSLAIVEASFAEEDRGQAIGDEGERHRAPGRLAVNMAVNVTETTPVRSYRTRAEAEADLLAYATEHPEQAEAIAGIETKRPGAPHRRFSCRASAGRAGARRRMSGVGAHAEEPSGHRPRRSRHIGRKTRLCR